jgi:hypothetical protein
MNGRILKQDMYSTLLIKKAARKVHLQDKEYGASNLNETVCCFDLQKVLTFPKSESGEFFY